MYDGFAIKYRLIHPDYFESHHHININIEKSTCITDILENNFVILFFATYMHSLKNRHCYKIPKTTKLIVCLKPAI